MTSYFHGEVQNKHLFQFIFKHFEITKTLTAAINFKKSVTAWATAVSTVNLKLNNPCTALDLVHSYYFFCFISTWKKQIIKNICKLLRFFRITMVRVNG